LAANYDCAGYISQGAEADVEVLVLHKNRHCSLCMTKKRKKKKTGLSIRVCRRRRQFRPAKRASTVVCSEICRAIHIMGEGPDGLGVAFP